MSKKLINSLWRFTVVNKFTLERVNNIFVLANSYRLACQRVYSFFDKSIFSIEMGITMPEDIVMVSSISSDSVNSIDSFVDTLY